MSIGQRFEQRSRNSVIVLCGFLMTLGLTGCGGSNSAPWETVYPVAGTVTYQGKPVANADVMLFPQDDSFPATVRPRAKSGADGTFQVWTWQRGDGAPAGSYKVTVVHHEIVVSNGAMGAKPNDLPKKYASPDTTDWVVQIAEEETTIPPFELH